MSQHRTKHIIEAALLTAGKPLTLLQLQTMLSDDETPLDKQFVIAALDALADDLNGRGVELRQVASGYRLQVKQEFEPWVARLFEERPPRYSRALLETLALIAYRQPITRAEIEDVRGVSVSSNIVKTLLEREWIKVVGQRDVPGRPSMYGTTKTFLDYFNIQAVSDLPPLDELMDLDTIDKQLDMLDPQAAANLPVEPANEADADVPAADAPALDGAVPVSPDGETDTALEHESPADSADASNRQTQSDEADSSSVAAAESDGADSTGAPEIPPEIAEDAPDTSSVTDTQAADTHDHATPSDATGPALDETADIDSLVDMLDQMDKVEVNALAENEPTDAPDELPETDATPSALARDGDTAAAVEAARLALAEQAENALENIAEREHDKRPVESLAGLEAGTGETPAVENALDATLVDEVASDDTSTVDAPDSATAELDDTRLDETHADEQVADQTDDTDSPNAHPAPPPPDDAHIAALIDADSRNHEAARGESITPADSLRRSSTDSTD